MDITREMIEAVAKAHLYREDYTEALRKVLAGKKITNSELIATYNSIIKHPDFNQIKDEIQKIETCSLVNDDMNTIMLQYNKLLLDAKKQGKFEVAARILKEIREIKSIDNEQTKFEVIIKVYKPEDKKKNE